MAPVSIKDRFANRFAMTLTTPAGGALTITEIPTNVNVFSRTAFIIHKLEYILNYASYDQIVAAADQICVGLVSSINVASILDNIAWVHDPSVIDVMEVCADLHGAAANMNIRQSPIVHDFGDMPGGGLLVSARPLYMAIQANSIAGAVQCFVRGWYTQIEMKDDEFIELVDYFRIM